jgi:predicted glycoside hydrolase/deacetylase ChbG (UPF0249 family)
MAAKFLIVNADDFNTDVERNRGILEAVEKGIVTSTTIIANMPGLKESLPGLVGTLGNRVGIHLNLTMGLPLTPDANTLVDRSGRFMGKRTAWEKALRGLMDLGKVEREFAAQISLLKSHGVHPDHIDGNNHIHVFPGIAATVARLANDFGIKRIRLPLERFSKWRQWVLPGMVKKAFFDFLSRRERSVFKRHGLRFTDHFAGIQFPLVSSLESLQSFLEHLPDGTTELMCHPGYRNSAGNPFSSVEREQELFTLTHPSVMERRRRLNIQLVSFSEIQT